MKPAGLRRLALAPESGTWFRALGPEHMARPLSTAHTPDYYSRFSPGPDSGKPIRVLYLSEDPVVCLFEVEALFGSRQPHPIPHPKKSKTYIPVKVSLQRVADLTLEDQQRLVGMTAQELTGDWDGYQNRDPSSSVPGPRGVAPTQYLGEALFETRGIEGFRTVSAKVPDQMNLVIFPSKLLKGSRIAYWSTTGWRQAVKDDL